MKSVVLYSCEIAVRLNWGFSGANAAGNCCTYAYVSTKSCKQDYLYETLQGISFCNTAIKMLLAINLLEKD